jgi:hypothetical protein
MKQLVVKEIESGQRLDKFLGKYLKEAPKKLSLQNASKEKYYVKWKKSHRK